MIVIEGTDLVGKTVLAEKLAEKLGFMYYHLKEPLQLSGYVNLIKELGPNVIFDRLHLSRTAYGKAVKNQKVLHPVGMKVVDDYITVNSGLVIVILGSEKDIRKYWRKDEMYSIENVLRTNHQYEKIVKNKHIKTDICIIPSEHKLIKNVTCCFTDASKNIWPSSHLDFIIEMYEKYRRISNEALR